MAQIGPSGYYFRLARQPTVALMAVWLTAMFEMLFLETGGPVGDLRQRRRKVRWQRVDQEAAVGRDGVL